MKRLPYFMEKIRPPIRFSASRIVIWDTLKPFATNLVAAAIPAAPAPIITTFGWRSKEEFVT